MIVDSYLPYISGVVTSVAAFTRALRADGHRVVIAAPRYPGHRDDDPDIIRLPSLPAPGTPAFRLLLPLPGRLLRDPRVQAADVVHVHGPFLAGTLGGAVARRLRRPLVFTHHTLYDQYVHYVPLLPAVLTRPAARRWVRAFANRCDLVIAPSEVIRARLRELQVTARIEVLPTAGIDPRQLGRLPWGEVRARYGIPPQAPLLVSVSRLAPEKSVDLVLRAFQQVAEPWGAYLLIVGDGPSAGDLRRLAGDLGIAGRVRFTGALPHLAALAAMSAGDLFVLASQTETQGVVLVEAMAVGLPVVAVARAGAAEVVRDGEAGVLVEPAPEALAAAVRRLLAEPARRAEMSRRAHEIAAGYAVPTLARRLAALYQSARAQVDRTPQRT
ncbi:MAG: glycosyltransferase [Armatimonadota bacterium]|nr:glycosyltransferase [Armatimonadota bacterium]MDR7465569.1 glycosyltransferase [Armatimonadota bacterium]MDR7470893.1 glycosyltransferase [Armatimonadota bacterium]